MTKSTLKSDKTVLVKSQSKYNSLSHDPKWAEQANKRLEARDKYNTAWSPWWK